jgi:predicted 2-oxoglutarate/Fe(II)-dependent dioxygenase YbiX
MTISNETALERAKFESPVAGLFTADLFDPSICDAIVADFGDTAAWVQAKITRYRGEADMRVESVLDPSRRLAERIHFSDLDLARHPRLVSFLDAIRANVMPMIQDEFGLMVREMGEAEIVRYPTGGLFTPHSDANIVKPYRAFSVILYLNDEFEGGGTAFPSLGFTCEPKKGRLLVFPSHVLHGGNPVTSGSKYIIVLWIFYPGSEDEYLDD